MARRSQEFTTVLSKGPVVVRARRSRWDWFYRTKSLLLLSVLSWLSCGRSQEAVRLSLAGETAAEVRRATTTSLGQSSFHLGTSAWNITAGLDTEVNDNVLFSSSQRQTDLILRPQVQTEMNWPVSRNNALNLAFETGYSAYTAHQEFNRFFIGPASELIFDAYAGDFWFRFHERLSVTEDAYKDPTVLGTANYSQLQDTAGLNTTWDLNKVQLSLAYDHTLYNALSAGDGFPGGGSDIWAASAGYRASATTQAGLQMGGGFVSYDGASAALKKAANWNLGDFIELQPTEYVRLRASAGYTAYTPQSGDRLAEFTGIYGQVSLRHRLNRWLEYDLSGGRTVNFGYYEGTIDLCNAVLDARWHFLQRLSVATGLIFERGTQVFVGHESFERFGPRLSLERPLTQKLWAALRYQFYHRTSNEAGHQYEMNIITASLVYRL